MRLTTSLIYCALIFPSILYAYTSQHHDMSMMDHTMHMSTHSTEYKGVPPSTSSIINSANQANPTSHMASSMSMSTMHPHSEQPPLASTDLREPDYANGRDYGELAPPQMMGDMTMSSVMIERLGIVEEDATNTAILDGEAWIGDNHNRAVLKLDAEKSNKKTVIDAKLMLRKPIASFWNIETGIAFNKQTYDLNQYALVLGINGLAPYWFKINTTVLLNQKGELGLSADASYDAWLTQRITLEPMLFLKASTKETTATRYGLRICYEPKRLSGVYLGFIKDLHSEAGIEAGFIFVY